MRIPKSFMLHGQEIVVEYSNTLIHRDDFRGVALFRDNKIQLQAESESQPHPRTQTEQTFCHELVHFLFNAAGYHEDRDDEFKVDRVAHLLHQALTTMEYESDVPEPVDKIAFQTLAKKFGSVCGSRA